MRTFAAVVSLLLLLASEGVRADEETATRVHETERLWVDRVRGKCNTYLLTCRRSRSIVVVDPCPEAVPVVRRLRSTGHRVDGVWLTQATPSHTEGLGELLQEVPGVTVWAHTLALEWLDRAEQGTPVGDRGRPVANQDVLTMGELSWSARVIPATSGWLVFTGDQGCAVVGDTLTLSRPTAELLRRPMHAWAARALRDVVWSLPDATVVLPGHLDPEPLEQLRPRLLTLRSWVHVANGLPTPPAPWLGIRLDTNRKGEGVALLSVDEGGPAAEAGLRGGDVIVRIGGRPIRDLRELSVAIGDRRPGEEVEAVYRRNGENAVATITLGRAP